MLSSPRIPLQPRNPSTPRVNDPLNFDVMMKKAGKTPTPKKDTLNKKPLNQIASDAGDTATSDNKDDDRIKVFLRMRPLLKSEQSIDYKVCEKTISIRPPNVSASSFCLDKSFSFRQIFDAESSQDDVFDTVARPLLPDFIGGNDVLIFCYGSTNAGKTFTVSGTDEKQGILQKSLNFIVSEITSGNSSIKLFASFFEIYNEKIYDLLDIRKNSETTTKLGFNKFGETEVKGTTELPVSSLDDVKSVIQKAESGRHRGSTELNCDSSRSHTIFQLKLKKKNLCSVFSVVDLAGSERLSNINSSIGSFKEACNINKSMLVLGKCIRKLKEQSTNVNGITQIPYRESKLTHLFKTFFEPVCRPSKAAMIINISPAVVQVDDTIFSLQFAAEAQQCSIRQAERPVAVSTDEDEFDISLLESQIEAKIREEMEDFLEKKRNEYDERLKQMNNACCNINQNNSSCNSVTYCISEYNNSSQNSLLSRSSMPDLNLPQDSMEIELTELKQRCAAVANENALLVSSIQYNKEEIAKTQAKNKQLIKKTTLLKSSLAEIECKNKQIEYQLNQELGCDMPKSLMPKLNEYDFNHPIQATSIMSKPKDQSDEKPNHHVRLLTNK